MRGKIYVVGASGEEDMCGLCVVGVKGCVCRGNVACNWCRYLRSVWICHCL